MLITLAEYKAFAGITDTGDDTALGKLVSGIDAGAKKFLRRNIEQQTKTEYLSGHGRGKLYLGERPLSAISGGSLGVWVDAGGYFGHGSGAFSSSTQLTLGVDFAPEDLAQSEKNQSCLVWLWGPTSPGGNWPQGHGNIKAVYTAGYSVVPEDIKLGCFLLAAGVWNDRKIGSPLESEQLGSYSYTLLSGGGGSVGWAKQLREAVGYLMPYREVSA